MDGKKFMLGIFRDITERKQVEDALKESKDNFIEAQEVAKLGHYVFDIKTGYWTSSDELDAIFGTAETYQYFFVNHT
jgi:uncharacterized Fe-S cluster-containing MiaB family protein